MKIYIPAGEYVMNDGASKMLDVSNTMTAEYVRSGKLNAIQLRSGRKKINLFPIAEIERFLKESKNNQ